MIAIDRDYYFPKLKKYTLIRILLRFFCLEYFGGKTWSHLLS